MTVEQFLAINADLPTERNGISIHFQEMEDSKGFYLYLDVPLDAHSRDLIQIAPLVQKWQKRILAQYDSDEANVIGAWAELVDKGEYTYSQLARHIYALLAKECYEYHATGNREHYHNVLRTFGTWGYVRPAKANEDFALLNEAIERITRGEPPFKENPITTDRVRNRINRWKHKQKKASVKR